MYKDFILANTPRILTQVDRDPDSMTYGSCDRNYWHLKIRDFSSAILQQTSLTLALLYTTEFDGNIYYKNRNIREWSLAALRYMAKIQLKDGSFNEYYPNEHGFPPTAFNLYAGCKTYLELELEDSQIKEMLGKSAAWLSNHSENKAYNQEWAAIAGLYLYYKISGEESFRAAVDDKVSHILAAQSADGWFPEQGGADIGYSSVALDMMAEYYWCSKDEKVLEPMLRLTVFLSYFVNPDGTIGGEYGSRNTIYFMPNGLETVLASNIDRGSIAGAMLDKIYGHDTRTDFMNAVDERYLSHYVMHSYLRSRQKYNSRNSRHAQAAALPYEHSHVRVFDDSGLITASDGEVYTVMSLRKGGLLKVYSGTKEIYWDCGYRIPIEPGITAATNWLDAEYNVSCDVEKKVYSVSGKFNKVKQKVQTPVYHLGLKVSAAILGARVNKLVKKLTIFQDNHVNADFTRTIRFGDNRIFIEDVIDNPNRMHIVEAPNVSLRLVASGKFFSRSDLLEHPLTDYGNAPHLKIIKVIDLKTGAVAVTED